MSPNDLRVRRTRESLRQALFSLIEERSFEELTIQDITDRAQINRVTFYKHYRDKYDLLEQTMHSMLDELASPIETLFQAPADETLFKSLVCWLEHVSHNARFYRIMLGKDGNAAFRVRLQTYLEQIVDQTIQKQLQAQPNPIPAGVRLRFAASGFLAVTEWWLEYQQPLDVNEIAELLHELLLNVVMTMPVLDPQTQAKCMQLALKMSAKHAIT